MSNTLTSSPATGTPAQQLSSIPRFGFIGTPPTAATKAEVAVAPFGLVSNANSSHCSASASLCFSAHPTGPADNSSNTTSSTVSRDREATSANTSTKQSGMVNGNAINNTTPSAGYHNGAIAGHHHKGSTKSNLLLPGFHQAPSNRNRGLNHSATKSHDIAESGAKSAHLSGQLSAPPQADQIAVRKEATVVVANCAPSKTTLDSSRISLLPSLSSAPFNTASTIASPITYNRSRTKSLESPDLAISSSTADNCNSSISKHFSALKFSAPSLHQLVQIPKMSTVNKLPIHRLIKSQSLRFDSSSHQNGTAYTGTSQIACSAKFFGHSLDTVDKLVQDCASSSKLPRSLTQESTKVVSNSMDEELSDHLTPGTLSRSSTASLGVLSNLNEVLAAAEDCSDYDDDPEFGTRLAAIDESLSPLPSLGFIDAVANKAKECEVAAITQQPEDSKGWSEMEKTMIMKPDNSVETATNIAAPEHDDISLNSIEISESYSTKTENTSQYEENEIYRRPSLKNGIQKNCTISIADSSTPPPANSARLGNFVSSTTKSRASAATTSRYYTPQAPTYNRMSKGLSSVSFSNRTNILATKAGSSKASSGTVSRTTTPTLSESEFGELNSLSSITSGVSLSKAVASKLSAHSKGTNQRFTTQRVLPTASKQLDLKKGRALATKKIESTSAPLSKSMPRSTTYTRSLNTATTNRQQQQFSASKSVADVKNSRPVNSKITVSTRVASSKRSTASTATTVAPFAKPTASYLKKTTTKAALSSSALPLQPKRPSSVSSNCSSVASSHQTTATKKSLVSSASPARSPALAVGAKRYPTTLLSAAAGGSSTKSSAASSRRSSITSTSKPTGPGLTSSTSSPHTAHKQTATENLRKYQALYWQQTEQIKRLRQELRQAGIQSAALLAINAHLINEYSPFKTPSLRAEIAVLHDKSCTLHRNYELSKEIVSQKETTILELETKLWEQTKELDAARNEGESLKAKLADVEVHLVEGEEERGGLQEELQELQQELEAEKEEHSNVLAKLNALEESCRSDKKYRDLKDKISTYQKEVDSLNVVIEMKTHRARNLELELMHCQSELANYENLKETLVQLRRENEALTETVGMKARKNAEQSREIDVLRSDLKRELNERKRASIRNDQLEYQLNETRELLHDRTFADMSSIMEDAKEPNTSQPSTPFELSNNSLANRFFSSASQPSKNVDVSNSAIHRNTGRQVRRLFSTPAALTSSHGEFQSHRQHFQHQEPISAESKHRLPELVLSSIGATNWTLTRPGTSSSSSSHCDNGQSDYHSSSNSANSSPLTSPKITKSKKNDSFKDFLTPNSSASMPTTTN